MLATTIIAAKTSTSPTSSTITVMKTPASCPLS